MRSATACAPWIFFAVNWHGWCPKQNLLENDVAFDNVLTRIFSSIYTFAERKTNRSFITSFPFQMWHHLEHLEPGDDFRKVALKKFGTYYPF